VLLWHCARGPAPLRGRALRQLIVATDGIMQPAVGATASDWSCVGSLFNACTKMQPFHMKMPMQDNAQFEPCALQE